MDRHHIRGGRSLGYPAGEEERRLDDFLLVPNEDDRLLCPLRLQDQPTAVYLSIAILGKYNGS